MDEPAPHFVTHPCATCGQNRLFSVVQREGRHRMICAECGVDLPARLGPVQDWRELLDGPRTDPPPDDGRRTPPPVDRRPREPEHGG